MALGVVVGVRDLHTIRPLAREYYHRWRIVAKLKSKVRLPLSMDHGVYLCGSGSISRVEARKIPGAGATGRGQAMAEFAFCFFVVHGGHLRL
jgi:hypothetical protein